MDVISLFNDLFGLLFSEYRGELLAVVSITLLTIIAPGPDFIMVVRNSLSHSRRSGLFTALGCASAVWLHIFYTLAGIGLLLSQSIVLFAIVKYLGAAYLLYLGWCCLRSKGNAPLAESGAEGQFEGETTAAGISDFQSFRMGFINNALNPKATLFFLSVFTLIVSPETPMAIQLTYGAFVSLSCLTWFCLVAVFLNRPRVRRLFESVQDRIEKVMGAVLIAFGVKVALVTQ